MPKTFKWTVEFEVHEVWVADGFDLDDERAVDMLNMDLRMAARDVEIFARVLKSPSQASIRKAQGFTP